VINHGYIPQKFSVTTLISIPKNKRKSLNDSNNYRGIAISSLIGKLFDYIIIDTNKELFKSSDLQFGFKSKHSTNHCTFVLQETINYYLKNNNYVYSMLLDASKAFDKINHIKLVRLLLQRGCCPLLARIIAVMYSSQLIRVKWLDNMSHFFNSTNGVKQGGVLSPLLFNIYLDELLFKLKNSGIGCYINSIYFGSLAYADDVILLCPTKLSLNKMLSIVKQYATDYDLTFNPSKSKYMTFTQCNDLKDSINFDGNIIERSTNETHLGNIIGRNSADLCLNKCISDFVTQFNSMISYFGKCKNDTKYKLLKTYCMPLYGSQLWNYSNNNINKFFVTWRKCIRRLFRIPYRTHCDLLNLICNDLPIDVQMHKRMIKFIHNSINSDNICIRTCLSLAYNGSQSVMCDNINYIFHKYGISKSSFSSQKLNTVLSNLYKISYDVDTESTANVIKELLICRDNSDYSFFTKDELHANIEMLCIN